MKIALVGISSSVAQALIPLLRDDERIESVFGVDIQPTRGDISHSKFNFLQMDKGHHSFKNAFKGIDCIIDLAWITADMHDKKEAYKLTVDATKKMVENAKAAGVKKILYMSSFSVYGWHRENPQIIDESAPLRPNARDDFWYSWDKAEMEYWLDEFCEKNPDMIITRFRLGGAMGEGANPMYGLIKKTPVLIRFIGTKPSYSLMHVDDIATALHLSIFKDIPGAYNLGTDDPVSIDMIAQEAGKKCLPVPEKFVRIGADVLYHLHLWDFSHHYLAGLRGHGVMDSSKLQNDLEWKPKYSGKQALKEFMKV